MRASSNGPRTSAKKKKVKPKLANNLITTSNYFSHIAFLVSLHNGSFHRTLFKAEICLILTCDVLRKNGFINTCDIPREGKADEHKKEESGTKKS